MATSVPEAIAPPPPPLMATCETAVILPLPSTVNCTACVESPKAPGLAFTVASVVALEPADVDTSPENAGSRVADRVPMLIWDASMLLLVSVCESLVPTIAPSGAPTAEVVLTPVRKTIPLEPGSPSPAGALDDCGTQVFTAVQAYKFC